MSLSATRSAIATSPASGSRFFSEFQTEICFVSDALSQNGPLTDTMEKELTLHSRRQHVNSKSTDNKNPRVCIFHAKAEVASRNNPENVVEGEFSTVAPASITCCGCLT
jgi:hypothetical protein